MMPRTMSQKNLPLYTIAAIILVAALMRLLPHPDNMTPIAAMALFGGAYIRPKTLAVAIPLLAMLVSDLFIGFRLNMLVIYGAFVLTVGIGMLLRGRISVPTVALASLASSLLFYCITNCVFLYNEAMYPHTLEGQMQSYIAAIPFFRNTVLGDLFFTTLLFGGYALLKRQFAALRTA